MTHTYNPSTSWWSEKIAMSLRPPWLCKASLDYRVTLHLKELWKWATGASTVNSADKSRHVVTSGGGTKCLLGLFATSDGNSLSKPLKIWVVGSKISKLSEEATTQIGRPR